MPSNKVFRKDIEVLKGKTKDRFMGIYCENLHPSSSFDVPTFFNKSASQYAYEHPENCEVLLISKKIWGKPVIQDAIGVLYRSLSNQSKDNDNADYRSRIGVCSDLSGSLSIGHYNYNPTPFSCIPSVKYQSDTGHLGYRLEFKETSLSSQTNHIVEAYDTLKKKGKKSYKYAITDECLLLTENLKSFKGIEEFCQNYEDYIVVINLGVMTKESFNYHLENNAFSPFVDNDYKVYLSKEVYNELIPIREYNADYAWKMTSPLHFLNCISNLPFLRLLCGCLGHLFQGIEEDSKYQNIISVNKLHTLSNLYEITRNRLKGSSNFYYSVGKGDSLDDFSRITLRLVTCFNEKENNKLKSFIYFTDVTIEKKNVPTADKKSVKVNPIVSFSKPIIKEIPNFSECDDDTIEDFIRDYFTKYPIISYGLRGIFQTALKKLNRDCISGCNVERTVYYLDLDDILTSFSMEKNEKLNKEYSKKRDNAPFYFEGSCVGMGDIIPEDFLKNSPIRATNSELNKDLKILYNNIQKYKGKNKLKDNDAISLLPLLYVLYTSVSLLTAKGIAYDTLSRIDFYYPPIFKVPNGDYNYSDLITQYCESGLLMGINVGEEAKKNGYKDYYYMPYDMLEGMDNLLLGVGTGDTITKSADSFDFEDFGVSLDNFNTEKSSFISSSEDVDLSLKEVVEDAKDSFTHTLSESTCSFCDSIAEQGAEHGDRNPKGYFYVDDGGPVDKTEMTSENIVVKVEDKEVSAEELAAFSGPEGQPLVDYSMDKDVGFGESIEAPDLAEELSKLDFDFNAMKDMDEPEDIDVVEESMECKEMIENKIENTLSPDNSEEVLSTDTSFVSDLFDKDNGFTDNQILLLIKKNVISVYDIQNYLISRIHNIQDISILLKLLKEL